MRAEANSSMGLFPSSEENKPFTCNRGTKLTGLPICSSPARAQQVWSKNVFSRKKNLLCPLLSFHSLSPPTHIYSLLLLISPWLCLHISSSHQFTVIFGSGLHSMPKWKIKHINPHSQHFVSGHLHIHEDKSTPIYIAKIAIQNLQKYFKVIF